MCWGTVGRVKSVEGHIATVDFGGALKTALVGVEDLREGDLVIVHAGLVIGKVTPEDAAQNVMSFRDILAYELAASGTSEEEAKREAEKQLREYLSKLGIEARAVAPESVEAEAEAPRVEIPPSAFRRTYRIALSDTDYLQVLHFTNYQRFCERAQQELLEELGFSYATLIHRYGLFIPTVESWGRYISPVRIDNTIEVAVWVEEIGKKHVKFRYVITNLTSGKVAGECYTVNVCTDMTLMESMPLPEELAKKLRKFSSSNPLAE